MFDTNLKSRVKDNQIHSTMSAGLNTNQVDCDNIMKIQSFLDDCNDIKEGDYLELSNIAMKIWKKIDTFDNVAKKAVTHIEILERRNKQLRQMLIDATNSNSNPINQMENRCQHIMKRGKFKGMKCMRPCDEGEVKCHPHSQV